MRPLILCPAHGRIEPDVNEMFALLRFQFGWEYRPWYGGLGVDRTRSQMASQALTGDHDVFFWCDDDNMLPTPLIVEMYETFRAEDMDMLCAVVPTRRMRVLPNFVPLDMGGKIMMGEAGGIIKAAYAGLALGFTRRRVWETLIEHEERHIREAQEEAASFKELRDLLRDTLKSGKLPALRERHLRAADFAAINWYKPELPEVDYMPAFAGDKFAGRPFFHPLVKAAERQHYGEDYSFCDRVRRAGMTIWVDTRKIACHMADNAARTMEDIVTEYSRVDQEAQKRAYEEAVVY